MADHTTLLKQLLPASYDASGRVLSASLQTEGAALDQALLLGDTILSEGDPRSTIQLLLGWERVLGKSAALDTPARRTFLVGKLNETGGQDQGYFIALAASLGFNVTITEFKPATILDDVMAPIYTPEWRYAWQVNVQAGWNTAYTQADILSNVLEPLGRWNQNTDFEAAMREDAPAHTQLLFKYN